MINRQAQLESNSSNESVVFAGQTLDSFPFLFSQQVSSLIVFV